MTDNRTARQDASRERRELRSYCLGAGLALLLTVVPFALVHWAALPRLQVLGVVGVCALVQMAVHLRCFLHVDFGRRRDTLLLVVFSALLLTIMVAGTVWIMASLDTRMQMPAAQQSVPAR